MLFKIIFLIIGLFPIVSLGEVNGVAYYSALYGGIGLGNISEGEAVKYRGQKYYGLFKDGLKLLQGNNLKKRGCYDSFSGDPYPNTHNYVIKFKSKNEPIVIFKEKHSISEINLPSIRNKNLKKQFLTLWPKLKSKIKNLPNKFILETKHINAKEVSLHNKKVTHWSMGSLDVVTLDGEMLINNIDYQVGDNGTYFELIALFLMNKRIVLAVNIGGTGKGRELLETKLINIHDGKWNKMNSLNIFKPNWNDC